MSAHTRIPYLQVRSDGVLFYEVSERPRVINSQPMLKQKAYSGKLTSHSQRRIMRSVDILLQRSPNHRIWNPVVEKHHDFRIGFATLTIPTHRVVKASHGHKNLLQPFLRTARRKWGIEDYIWKAELQERGQLHYHITWNRFVEFTRIRDEWNKLLRKNRLSDEFAARYGHFNPNSTDIHAVWKVRNLKAYLAKYIAKDEQNKTRLDGKIWDASKSLKRPPFTTVLHGHHEDYLRDGIQMGLVKTWESEHAVLFKMENPLSVLTSSELAAYKQHIS